MAYHVQGVLEEDQQLVQPGTPNFWHIAWRWKLLLVLGVLVGLAGGYFYQGRQAPHFESSAQVLVVKKRPDALPIMGSDPRYSAAEDYLSTHQVLLKSPVIIQRFARKKEIQALRSFEGSDPTAAIIGSMTIQRDKDAGGNLTNILVLSYRGTVADECPTVLNAVIESYKEFLDETYRNISADTVDLITKARNVLQKDLAEKETGYREFRQKTPLLWKNREGINLHQERLANVASRRSAVAVRKAEIQGRLASLDASLKDPKNRTALMAMIAELATKYRTDGIRRGNSTNPEEQQLALALDEQRLLQSYGPDHPEVQQVRNRMKKTRDFFNESAPAKNEEKTPGQSDPLDFYMQTLRHEMADLESSEQALAALFQVEQAGARELTNFEIQDEARRSDILRTQQLYDSIIKRLQEIDLIKDLGGFDARVVSPPSAAIRIGASSMSKFSLAGVLGLVVAMGLAFFLEIRDQSFRTPEEIRQWLGWPVLGHVPTCHQKEDAPADSPGQALDPMLFTFHQPQSEVAEVYRGLRAALLIRFIQNNRRVIQVTSPNVGDGKTTLAANLAVCMAQSGLRVVLIDADFRAPRLHKIFGLTKDIGMTSILQGQAEWKDTLQGTDIPGLSLILCGPTPTNPAELLTSVKFKDTLEALRQEYDLVLLDTPPMLAVSDPCVVASRVDGVLLTMQVASRNRLQAKKVKELLEDMGANVLGVVINAVDPEGTRYLYQGSYEYGYGYGKYGTSTKERVRV